MKPIYNFKTLSFLVIIVFSSCSSLKIIEKSSAEKPIWIHGIESNFLIGEGCGGDYNEAKYDALKMIKEKIVSSVAQNISFEENIKVNEIRYKRAIEFLEEYTSKTISKTGNRAYLKGVSLSKVSDYYWEKHRVDKIEKIFYYIKYPFTQKDIDILIKEWKLQEKEFSKRLDTLSLNIEDYSSIESIISEIEELQFLSDFFVDQRKATADISVKSLKNKLNAIQIMPLTDSLGFFKYFLMLGEDTIYTTQKPLVKSNCAIIEGIKSSNKTICINYNYNDCSVDEQNFIEVKYAFEEWELARKVPFDVTLKKIAIENTNDISFSSVHKKTFKKDHTINCYLAIRSKSPVPFRIDRVELIPKLCKHNCDIIDNYKVYPLIVIDNINKSFSGKGIHTLEIRTVVDKSKSKSWASRNGTSTKIDGRIYYSSDITGESKVTEFKDLEYFTDW